MAKFKDTLIQAVPGLLKAPDWPLVVGDMAIGAMARAGMLKVFRNDGKAQPAAAAPAAKRTPAAPKPAGPASSRATANDESKAAAAVSAAADSGDKRALAAALAHF